MLIFTLSRYSYPHFPARSAGCSGPRARVANHRAGTAFRRTPGAPSKTGQRKAGLDVVVSKNKGTPSHHPSSWDFPWNKPSIVGCPHDCGKPHTVNGTFHRWSSQWPYRGLYRGFTFQSMWSSLKSWDFTWKVDLSFSGNWVANAKFDSGEVHFPLLIDGQIYPISRPTHIREIPELYGGSNVTIIIEMGSVSASHAYRKAIIKALLSIIDVIYRIYTVTIWRFPTMGYPHRWMVFVNGEIPSFEMDDDDRGTPMTQEPPIWQNHLGGFKQLHNF